MSTSAPARLFQPVRLGALSLSTRVVMAPLTRMRAGPGEVPTALNAEYYEQRASPGVLIIAEASQVAAGGQGYAGTPGIFTREQLEGWRGVVDRVHGRGGQIVLQLWHVGRVSHSSFQRPDEFPQLRAVSSSAVAIRGSGVNAAGERVPFEVPRPLEEHEIGGSIVGWYARAAQMAHVAGFDGVELHAANGYLMQQFLADNVNRRADRYGGSVENRCRIVLEVLQGIFRHFEPARVGIRLSPWGSFMDIDESDPLPLYSHLLGELDKLGLAYVHLIEPRVAGSGEATDARGPGQSLATLFRPVFRGPIVIAGGYTRDTAVEIVESGAADAVAFGRMFISNPDLPRRLRDNLPLTPYQRATFYTKGPQGYTDYPFYESGPSKL